MATGVGAGMADSKGLHVPGGVPEHAKDAFVSLKASSRVPEHAKDAFVSLESELTKLATRSCIIFLGGAFGVQPILASKPKS